MNYLIEKDRVLNCFVVWEVHTNYMIERFRGLKKECKEWIKNIEVIQ